MRILQLTFFYLISLSLSFQVQSNPIERANITKGIELIKVIQKIFDDQPGYFNNYYEYSEDGVNPFRPQTKSDVLILKGSVGTIANKLFTPIGTIQISGSEAGDLETFQKLNDEIKKIEGLKLKLICPRFITHEGEQGPWYLITHIEDVELLEDNYTFEEAKDEIKPIHIEHQSEEYRTIIEPRIQLLQRFFKDHSEHYSYEESNQILRDIEENNL